MFPIREATPEELKSTRCFDFTKSATKQASLATIGVDPQDIKSNAFQVAPPNTTVLFSFPPQLMMTTDQMKALQENDWSKIQKFTSEIIENINANGARAWAKYPAGGGQAFAMSRSDKGSIWAWPVELPADHPAQKGLDDNHTAYYVQMGTCSETANYTNISYYVISNVPTGLPKTDLIEMFASLFSSLVQKGVVFAVSYVTSYIASYLAQKGFSYVVEALTSVAASPAWSIAGPIAAIVHALMSYFMPNVIFRQYVLQLSAYNFDERPWVTSQNAVLENTDMGQGGSYAGLYIPGHADPSKFVFPQGFTLVADAAIGNLPYLFMNTSTFLQGLTVGLQFIQSSGSDSFATKYNLKRVGNNQIGVLNGTVDLEDYVNNQPYNNGTVASTNSGSLKIVGFTRELKSADDNVYYYNVIIGSGKTPSYSSSH